MTHPLRRAVDVSAKRQLKPPPDPPRLWPNLAPTQRQQLAQCLAELIRRMPRANATAPKEVPHESL